jgi:hypothetical protein
VGSLGLRGLERCSGGSVGVPQVSDTRCLPTATGQDSERVHMPACKCIEWEKGADASYMHPAASKIRKFMLSECLYPWPLQVR